MAKRVEYQIVGRYMNGKEITGYHLHSMETGKSKRFTKEQVCFLVGRGQVTNCTGQIYNDKVLLRGNGMSLDDLPVQYEDGTSRNMDRVGKVRANTDAASAMTQFLIVGTIKSGRNTVGYVIQNAGCGIKRIKRQQVIELAQAGKIGNARVQTYQGKVLLRGVGCNLDELPSELMSEHEDTGVSNGTKTRDTIKDKFVAEDPVKNTQTKTQSTGLEGIVTDDTLKIIGELDPNIQKLVINICKGLKAGLIDINTINGVLKSNDSMVLAVCSSGLSSDIEVNKSNITLTIKGLNNKVYIESRVVKSIKEIINVIKSTQVSDDKIDNGKHLDNVQWQITSNGNDTLERAASKIAKEIQSISGSDTAVEIVINDDLLTLYSNMNVYNAITGTILISSQRIQDGEFSYTASVNIYKYGREFEINTKDVESLLKWMHKLRDKVVAFENNPSNDDLKKEIVSKMTELYPGIDMSKLVNLNVSALKLTKRVYRALSENLGLNVLKPKVVPSNNGNESSSARLTGIYKSKKGMDRKIAISIVYDESDAENFKIWTQIVDKSSGQMIENSGTQSFKEMVDRIKVHM